MDIVPYEARIVIPVKDRDDKLLQIQNLIDAKRKMLSNKQKKLRFISKQNKFLEAVRNDYEKYNNYMIQQKTDQIRALQLIDDYIKDLTTSGKLTRHNIEDAREEQAKILREVKSIKESLDSIVDETNYVETTLNQKKNLL